MFSFPTRSIRERLSEPGIRGVLKLKGFIEVQNDTKSINQKNGGVMGKIMGRNREIFSCLLFIIVLISLGCGYQQSPPPAAPPASGTAQAPPPASSPATASQPVAPPAGTPQPAPAAPPPGPASPTATPQAGTGQPSAAATPSQDLKQLYLGMPSDQAQGIMGVPGETRPGKGVTRWFYSLPQGKVEVRIKNNQVVAIELE
jgi:hypothetical protein